MSLRIGFMVPHLGASQMSYRLIRSVNEVHIKSFENDIVVFPENFTKPCYPTNFAIMNIVDAWSYTGNMVATTLTSAHKLLNLPSVQTRNFYVWELEWINIKQKNYEALASVYQSQKLELLARSIDHAKAIEKAWGRPVKGVIGDFDVNKLVDIFRENEQSNVRTHKKLL